MTGERKQAEIIEAALKQVDFSRPPLDLDEVDASMKSMELAHTVQKLEQRRTYGKWLLWLLVGHLALVHVGFGAYMIEGKGFDVPDGVMQAWFAATSVQVVGLALVVVRNLFPNRDSASG